MNLLRQLFVSEEMKGVIQTKISELKGHEYIRLLECVNLRNFRTINVKGKYGNPYIIRITAKFGDSAHNNILIKLRFSKKSLFGVGLRTKVILVAKPDGSVYER